MEELCYAETRLPGVQIVEKAHVQRQVGKTARGGGGDAMWRAALLHPNTWNRAKTWHKI